MPKGEVFRTTIVKKFFLIKSIKYKHHLENKTKLNLKKRRQMDCCFNWCSYSKQQHKVCP